MKYSTAIGGPDEDAWKEEIKNEHERTKKYDVFKEVKRQELPAEVKTIDSTRACKKKSNGTLRGRLTARGFRQIKGQHYDNASISAPVTNTMTIRIIMTIMLMYPICTIVCTTYQYVVQVSALYVILRRVH